jgi:NitT/TauT family transport system permease protein
VSGRQAFVAEEESSSADRRSAWLELAFPVVSFAVVLVAWAAVVAIFSVPRYVIPSPASVASSVAEHRSDLVAATGATAWVALVGLLVSVVVGIPTGLVVARWPLVRRLLMPPLVAIQSLPKVALAPLFVAWLGFGAGPKLVITVLITFFPLTLATIVGVESVLTTTIDVARSMGCRGRRFLSFVLMPSAAPYIAAAFRTSATLAVVGTLVSEFVGSANGLGNLLLIASGNRDTPLAFGAILTVAVLGIVFYVGAGVISRLATIRLGTAYMRSVT